MPIPEPDLHKAVACVVRPSASAVGGHELLVFDHPVAGTQVPKGTMDPGEGVTDAARRELLEESGVSEVRDARILGSWMRRIGAGPREDGRAEFHLWHIVLLHAARELPDAWNHTAHGSPEEDGLVFAYRWVQIDDDLPSRLHPLFANVAAFVVADVCGSAADA